MSERKGKRIVRRRTDARTAPKVANKVSLQISEAIEYFYTYKQAEGVRDRTLKDYRDIYHYFSEWIAEDYPLVTHIENVTTLMLREYIVYLSEDRYNNKTDDYGLSPYTVNVRLRFLKTFFGVLHREGIINTNPAALVKLMKVDEDSFVPLSDKELNALLDVPKNEEYSQFRDKVAMMLILDTGIRPNELFNIQRKDIDIKSRSIILPGSKTKNRKPRILPLSNEIVRLLLELMTEVEVNFDTDYVFVSNFGENYRPSSFRRRVAIYKEKAGITKRVSPYSLRHQFCHDYIMNGGDVFTLQRIAGHEDISTTRKYMQFTTEDIRRQHTKFSPLTRIRKRTKI